MTQQIQKKAGMYKQIKTDFNYGFGKLVDLTVFLVCNDLCHKLGTRKM